MRLEDKAAALIKLLLQMEVMRYDNVKQLKKEKQLVRLEDEAAALIK